MPDAEDFIRQVAALSLYGEEATDSQIALSLLNIVIRRARAFAREIENKKPADLSVAL